MMAGQKEKMRTKRGTKIEVNAAPASEPESEATETPEKDEAVLEAATSDKNASEPDPEALAQQLAEAEAETKQLYDRFLRVSAEFDNYKKRQQRDSTEYRKYATEAVFKDLLSVVDNLERALEAGKNGSGQTDAANGLIKGVEITLSEILRIFEKFGVSPIEALEQPFDPTYHQAVQQEVVDEKPDNTVVGELQKGYVFHDRLLRPSMVVVSKKR